MALSRRRRQVLVEAVWRKRLEIIREYSASARQKDELATPVCTGRRSNEKTTSHKKEFTLIVNNCEILVTVTESSKDPLRNRARRAVHAGFVRLDLVWTLYPCSKLYIKRNSSVVDDCQHVTLPIRMTVSLMKYIITLSVFGKVIRLTTIAAIAMPFAKTVTLMHLVRRGLIGASAARQFGL
jgi:hypothetical protein